MPCCGGPIPCHDDDDRFLEQGPDETDLRRFGDDTMPCAHCAASISSEAVRCPLCGQFQVDQLVQEDFVAETAAHWPIGRTIALIAGLAAMLLIVLL